jgi:hypothetical protein
MSSWWSDANEAEDPDLLIDQLRSIGRGVRRLFRELIDEVRREREARR